MALHGAETEQTLPIGRAEAWDFFSDPRNLSVVTTPDMGFEVTSPISDRAYAGLIISYRVRPLFRIPVQWVTEITHVDEGNYFVDEQRLGTYRVWHHEHRFIQVPGGIHMRDIVHYSVPFGLLGDIVERLVVGKRVEAIFAFRPGVPEQRFEELVAS
jgi:ligand-binding SRPBCC domain-containing protein